MNILTITKENFEEEVMKSDKPVLIDFWAAWCGPCKMVAPIIEEVAMETQDIAIVGKVNVDEEPELAQAFNVQSIPTLVVFKDGKIVESVVGVRPKEVIISMLK